MDNVKLSVTFILPGSTMLTSQECEENPTENYQTEQVQFYSTVKVREGKKIKFKHVKDSFTIKTRKCIPAKQVVNMTSDAYFAMISGTPVEGFMPGAWKKLSKHEKIEAHLERLAKDYNAIDFTYTILED